LEFGAATLACWRKRDREKRDGPAASADLRGREQLRCGVTDVPRLPIPGVGVLTTVFKPAESEHGVGESLGGRGVAVRATTRKLGSASGFEVRTHGSPSRGIWMTHLEKIQKRGRSVAEETGLVEKMAKLRIDAYITYLDASAHPKTTLSSAKRSLLALQMSSPRNAGRECMQ
jgi:hypothetical protein